MEQVLDINGANLVEGDIVTIEGENPYTYRVTEVWPGRIGLILAVAHGLAHNAGRRGVQLLEGGDVRRVADTAPVLMHRDGLVAFG